MMREWPYTALGRDELGCPSPLTSKFPWALGKSLRLRGCTLFIPTHLSSRQCSLQIQYDKLNHEKFCPSNLVFGTSIGYSHTSIPSIPIPVFPVFPVFTYQYRDYHRVACGKDEEKEVSHIYFKRLLSPPTSI